MPTPRVSLRSASRITQAICDLLCSHKLQRPASIMLRCEELRKGLARPGRVRTSESATEPQRRRRVPIVHTRDGHSLPETSFKSSVFHRLRK